MKHLFLFGALIIVLFASCSQKVAYTVVHKQPSQEFVGNKFDEFKGKTVNEIMREMSVPNREMPDGADGKILIYEDIKFVTTSSNTHSTHSTSASYGTAVAGYNYRGNPQVNSNAYGSSSTTNTDRGKSVSEEQKKYVNFFINPNGVCYDVKANYGDLYKRIPKDYMSEGFLMGDYPMWIEFSLISKIKCIPDITSVYRILENSASHHSDIHKQLLFTIDSIRIRKFYAEKYHKDELLEHINQDWMYWNSILLAVQRKTISSIKLYIKSHKKGIKNFLTFINYFFLK
jgi:hypothetical protein